MSLLDWLLPVVLVILGLRELLPRAIRLFRTNWLDTYFEEDTQLDIQDQRLKEVVDGCVNKLKSMGFSIIGIRAEKPPVWGSPVKELTLVSVADNTFFCIYIESKTVKYYFYTPFSGGQAVISTYAAYKNENKDYLIIYRTNKNDIGEIFAVHKRNVETFIGKGFIPYREYTWQSRLKAAYLYYNSPQVKKTERTATIISFVILVVCFVPLIFTAFMYFRQ